MTAPRGESLAYATLDYIRENPREWNQFTYFCGSTACFAGRAWLIGMGETLKELDYRTSSPIAAAQMLGWTVEQAAYVFFFFTYNFDELEKRVKEVLNGEIK